MGLLSNGEREMLASFAEALIPGHIDVNLVDRIENHIKYFSKDVRLSFRLIIAMFDYGAIFYRLHLKTFRKMPVTLKERYLSAWHHSKWAPKRALWRFLSAIVYMNYYAVPEVSAGIGYTPKFKPPKPSPKFPRENLFAKPFEHDLKEECDVCIIGSGAGGAVAAKVLAEAGRSVVILEEGGFFDVNDFGKDALAMTKLLYRNGGVINTFGWPAIVVPVGCCAGGTTVINSGTCFRTPSNVLERWVNEFGLTAWSPERMERYYKDVETNLHVSTADSAVLKKNSEIFKRGIEALGFKGAPLKRDAPDCKGSGVCCWGCPTNAKESMQLNYIPMALSAGAKLYTHCQASRFLYKGSHAETVIARFRRPETRARLATLEVNARVVLVASGSFHSPVLLLRSHVPNFSGMIGHNLSLHPAGKVMALFNEDVRGWDEIPQGYYMDALAGSGIMFEGIFLPPPYTASTVLHIGEKHKNVMENYNRIATFGLMVSDTSRGRILRLPGGRPVTIYNINRADLGKYLKGIATLAEAFFAAGADKVLLPIHTIPELSREEGTEIIYKKKIRAKDLDLQAFHPLGTCRMGADPKMAVCDPYGRLYGLDNVFVADGSIFPTSLGVNPMLTIMSASHKISEYIDREVL